MKADQLMLQTPRKSKMIRKRFICLKNVTQKNIYGGGGGGAVPGAGPTGWRPEPALPPITQGLSS